MSVLPILLSDSWDDEFERPLNLLSRHYGMTMRPEDLFDSYSPRSSDILIYRPLRKFGRRFQPYETKENKSKGASVVKADKEKFQVTLDVQHFTPEEISVKVVGNNVVVEGKHEEKEDEHGWVSREFSRKYLVPTQCDIDQVKSNLSSDGLLTITAPRKLQPAIEDRERVIKIQHTGKPALQENKAPGQPIANGGEKANKDAEKNGSLDPKEKEKLIAAA